MEEDLDFRTQKAYDAMYTGVPKSETLLRIWRDVYGDDYPEGVEPFSFVTRTDLTHIVEYLKLNPGDTLVDLGCGRGGPGLWVARETGADLVGIDLSPDAVEQARQRIANFGLQEYARFLTADFCATGLPDESCEGGMSIDMLWMVEDKGAAMAEVKRILCPGGRFVFTTWEPRDGSDPNYDMPLSDHGLVVEEHAEKPDSDRRRRAMYASVVAYKDALIAEMGAEAALPMIAEATLVPPKMGRSRHVLIACRRPS